MDRFATLTFRDPPEGNPEVPTEGVPRPVKGWGKPRRAVPPKPADIRDLTVSDLPPGLMPPPPPDASTLVQLGTVCGYEIHARRDVVERAEQLRKNLGTERNWPKDALLATILALRIGAHMTYREIAVSLGMSERHVLRVAKRGKKDLVVEREVARLDREGMPMAVENVLEGLQDKDKEYTLEYLKGRGVFRQKQDPAGAPPATAFPGLVVQFIHDGNVPPEMKAGTIISTPNRALAAVVPSTPVLVTE